MYKRRRKKFTHETFHPLPKTKEKKPQKLILYESAESDLTETFFKIGNFSSTPSISLLVEIKLCKFYCFSSTYK